MNHRSSPHRRGVSVIETLVTVSCGAALLALVLAAAPPQDDGPRPHARSVKDGLQLRQIHASLVAFGREYDMGFPRPGLIDRLPTGVGGVVRDIPGRGAEDVTQNTTANLYAALIMQNYCSPALCISTVERNPNVKGCTEYDYARYDPVGDVYWDPAFKADLKVLSHTSYAHLVIHGRRADRQWRVTSETTFPVLCNRGPRDGKVDPDSFTCGPHGHWAGFVVYNDNHVVMESATTPSGLVFDGKKPDNLFAFDDGIDGGDAILTFTKAMTADGPEVQFD